MILTPGYNQGGDRKEGKKLLDSPTALLVNARYMEGLMYKSLYCICLYMGDGRNMAKCSSLNNV